MKNFLTALALSAAFFQPAWGQESKGEQTPDLTGLWQAHEYFGPEVQGKLLITRNGDDWTGEISGYTGVSEPSGDDIGFSLPGGRGEFRGRLEGEGITGHWIQPGNVTNGNRFASPVKLEKVGENAWAGEVIPLRDEFTVYLPVFETENGVLNTYIRNPDRNIGVFVTPTRIEFTGSKVEVYTNFRGRGDERLGFSGAFDAENQRMSFFLPFAGSTFDFYRGEEDGTFYARGKNPSPYEYTPPLEAGDGWAVGTLEEAGIALGPLKEMIEKKVYPAPEDVHSHDLHGVLIFRHGKLVFEEYFHGYNRERAHDTRSASKSLLATLVGAALEAGLIEGIDIPVYETLYDGELPEGLDPRKARMTLRHLLTMTSGYYCDDSDYQAPGNEDNMQSQEDEPDWYKYTLEVPMALEPGEKAIYCSSNPNLAGAVLSKLTGKSLEELFETLIAQPLEVDRYYLNLQPTGEPYMGGGIYWLPRDFPKLGQVMLDGGAWKDARVISEEWAETASSALYNIGDRGYGYLWWVQDFPYKDRTVKTYYAGGNGGQMIMVVPELDLVVNFWGGNYSDRSLFISQNVLFPEYILRAVAEGEGD